MASGIIQCFGGCRVSKSRSLVAPDTFSNSTTLLLDQRERSGLMNVRGVYRKCEHVFRPTQGPIIPGGGGLRKLRWSALGRGKRGEVRLIYYWESASQMFYMLYLYAKNEQGDLTAAQLKALAKLVREEFT